MPPHQLHPDSAGLPAPPVSAAGTEPRPHWARALPAPLPVQCPPLRLSDGPAALRSLTGRAAFILWDCRVRSPRCLPTGGAHVRV